MSWAILSRPYGTGLAGARTPSTDVLGYSQPSLRDSQVFPQPVKLRPDTKHEFFRSLLSRAPQNGLFAAGLGELS
jgi:hypothetical protein